MILLTFKQSPSKCLCLASLGHVTSVIDPYVVCMKENHKLRIYASRWDASKTTTCCLSVHQDGVHQRQPHFAYLCIKMACIKDNHMLLICASRWHVSKTTTYCLSVHQDGMYQRQPHVAYLCIKIADAWSGEYYQQAKS